MPLTIRCRIIVTYELEKNVEQEVVSSFKTVLFPLCKLQVPRRLPQTLITRHDVINKALMFAQFRFG